MAMDPHSAESKFASGNTAVPSVPAAFPGSTSVPGVPADFAGGTSAPDTSTKGESPVDVAKGGGSGAAGDQSNYYDK